MALYRAAQAPASGILWAQPGQVTSILRLASGGNARRRVGVDEERVEREAKLWLAHDGKEVVVRVKEVDSRRETRTASNAPRRAFAFA